LIVPNTHKVLQIVINSSSNTFVLNITDEAEYQVIEYNGIETEITDLIIHLNRKFKKSLGIGGFENNIQLKLIDYIDYLIEDGLYDLRKIEETSEKPLFYLITSDKLISFGVATKLEGLFSPTSIDYSNSFLIEGIDSLVTETLLTSMKLDFGFISTNDIPFDISIIDLLQTKINILKRQNKIKFLNISSKLIKVSAILTSSEVCEILQISKQTLSIWRKENKIKFIKKSNRIFVYNRTNVMKILDAKTNNITLDSSEVCEILQISKQLLMYWRRTNKIKFDRISNRNIQYDKSVVQELLNTKLLMGSHEIKGKVKETKNIELEIIEWVTAYSYKISEQKYAKQLFFLNFGNVDIISSPQVMISNNYKLVDVINDKVLIANPTDLIVYLRGLTDKSMNPLIDTSKQYYPGFRHLYLNKLDRSFVLKR